MHHHKRLPERGQQPNNGCNQGGLPEDRAEGKKEQRHLEWDRVHIKLLWRQRSLIEDFNVNRFRERGEKEGREGTERRLEREDEGCKNEVTMRVIRDL
jgi:hypothetical protein